MLTCPIISNEWLATFLWQSLLGVDVPDCPDLLRATSDDERIKIQRLQHGDGYPGQLRPVRPVPGRHTVQPEQLQVWMQLSFL